MRSWDELIEIEAGKVLVESRKQLSELIALNNQLSVEIGSEIDKILNKLTRREAIVEYGVVDVVRNDDSLREWETTFSVVNMAGNCIVRLACEGYYLQAVSLVRQELEGVAEHVNLI